MANPKMPANAAIATAKLIAKYLKPVEHNGQIDKAACHRDVRDVHRPHLVRPNNLHPTQQIRVDFVTWTRSFSLKCKPTR